MSRRAVVGVIVLVVALVAGAAFFAGRGQRPAASQYLTATAQIADVVAEAVANGTIEPSQTYTLSFGSPARLVASSFGTSGATTGGSGVSGATSSSVDWLVHDVAVAVGDAVTVGAVLATADAADAQRQVDLAQARVDAAQAKLDADTGGITDADRQAAQIALDQARQQLTGAEQSRDETINQNRIKVDQARDAVNRADDQLADDKDAGAPRQVLDADRLALRQARDGLELAQAQADASNQQARQQVEAARLAVDSAQNAFESTTSSAAPSVIAADRASLIDAQSALADAQTILAGATLTAPVDGYVAAINIAPGAFAPSGEALRVISRAVEVTADFAEADLPSIRSGQPARVEVSATDETLDATVSAVTPQATSETDNSVVSFNVTATLGDVPASVFAGMSAELSIVTARADGVIAVPSIALEGSADSYQVKVLDGDGNVSTRDVQVGLVSEDLAEIVSGVSAGETVVTGTTASLQPRNPFGFPQPSP
jgi:RND family efflux transporter MFP subunit